MASPALAPDGTILSGALGSLVCVRRDGTIKWRYNDTGHGLLYPLVADDTTLAGVDSRTGSIILLGLDGKPIFIAGGSGPLGGNPALGQDGALYLPGKRELWAFTGRTRLTNPWRVNHGWDGRWHGLAVGADGTIYGATHNGSLWAIRKDGVAVWSTANRGGSQPTPAISSDGTLYVNGSNGVLSAISPDGRLVWAYEAGAPLLGPPVIGPSGSIYVGSDDHKLHAVSPLGKKRWTFSTGGPIRSAAAVARDGTIYVGSNDGRLYAVLPDGSAKWSYETHGAVFSPTLLIDGTLVFESGDGFMRAITDPGCGGLASSPWPKWAADLRNTAQAPRPSPTALAPPSLGSYDSPTGTR